MSSDETTDVTVGQMIRADREAVGMTIAQLAQATKIMVTFVESLENDDIEALPGRVFAKGFIKSIYKVLGKDSGPVLEKFEADNDVEQTRVVPVTRVDRLQTEIVSRQSSGKRLPPKIVIGATLIGAALVALIWFLTQQTEREENAPQQVTQESRTLPIDSSIEDEAAVAEPMEEANTADEDVVAQVEEQEPAVKDDAPVVAEAPEPIPNVAKMQAESATSEGQLLEIVVRKSVKIRMNIDYKGWETNELEPDTYQFRFDEAANLLLFNAAAVDMSFNGKDLGKLGDEGRVRRLSFVAGAPKDAAKM